MKPKAEHNYFAATGIWYILIVFWGFAPSFYLSNFFENPEPLPKHLVIHGIIFTIWIVLYAIQVLLIRFTNFQLHQQLGIFGLCILILMIPSGIFPSIYKVYAGTTTIDAAGHNVFRLVCGYILIILAFINRKKSFLHKRYMLGGMVMLMSAAIFRMSFDFNLEASQLFNKGLQVLPALLLFVFDFAWYKKLVFIDLISVIMVFAIYFFADYFWLSNLGKVLMDSLIYLFVTPFLSL